MTSVTLWCRCERCALVSRVFNNLKRQQILIAIPPPPLLCFCSNRAVNKHEPKEVVIYSSLSDLA